MQRAAQRIGYLLREPTLPILTLMRKLEPVSKFEEQGRNEALKSIGDNSAQELGLLVECETDRLWKLRLTEDSVEVLKTILGWDHRRDMYRFGTTVGSVAQTVGLEKCNDGCNGFRFVNNLCFLT